MVYQVSMHQIASMELTNDTSDHCNQLVFQSVHRERGKVGKVY